MNDTPQPDNLQTEKSFSDRILGYSLAASLFINLGWVLWVAHSDIFGSANIIPLHEKPIKIFKPIPQKPKPPKPPKPPPPPPPQKQPKIKPPPIHIQRPTPRPPVPTHQFKVATTTNTHAVSNIVVPTTPDTAPPPQPVMPSPGPSVVAPPPPVEQPPPPVVVPPPPVEPPKPEPKPEVVAPPPPPPPPPKPRMPDRDEPEVVGSFDDITLPSFDPSTVSVTQISATWEVDERGHPSNIHLSPRTSGNSEVDSAIVEAIRKFRFRPRVHNGQAEAAELSHTFSLGG